MKRLFIIDLDGVIFDHTHRDHLIPEVTTHNSHWEKHQAPGVVRLDPIHHDHVSLIKAMLNGSSDFLFLSSRSIKNKTVTLNRLASLFFEHSDTELESRYICRGKGDHRTAGEIKASVIDSICRDNKKLREIVFIEDSLVNVNWVMKNHSHPKVKIIPVLLGYTP